MKQIRDYWQIIVGLILAGMWLGSLQQRVNGLEHEQRYLHGTFTIPEGK
jgi:hypothetical protein